MTHSCVGGAGLRAIPTSMRYLSAMLFLVLPSFALAAPDRGPLQWREWSEAVFAEAASKQKYVLLHLGADWCHWCHVMERTTYRDAEVVAKVEAHFIPVRVEQDERPDISRRYERFGWPATILFDAEGNEILVRRGYREKARFLTDIQTALDDPSPLPNLSFTPNGEPGVHALDEATRKTLESIYFEVHDPENGGFGDVHRFINGPGIEWAIHQARRGDLRYREVVQKSLDGARMLIDPVWGGIYQYSDKLDWSSPHYEKIMQSQRDAIRIYALAFAAWGDLRNLASAVDVASYLLERLRGPNGAFYTSQDADLDEMVDGKAFYPLDAAGRAAFGREPRIDRNQYPRENGWAAASLALLSDISGDKRWLDAAVDAVEWALSERRTGDGGFGRGHGQTYLGDNLAMGEALLALYRSTGDRRWLTEAIQTADYIETRFKSDPDGYQTAPPMTASLKAFQEPVRHLDENMDATRFFNLIRHYTGDPRWERAAKHGMRHLAAYAPFEIFLPHALLPDAELAREPAHATVVGGKGNSTAAGLHAAARAYPTAYYRLEWWDRSEGSLPNPDVTYPDLDEAAAYACSNGLCSLPVTAPSGVAAAIRNIELR